MSILYYTINNSVFTNFAFYSTASVVKMMGLSALTAFTRLSKDVRFDFIQLILYLIFLL